MATEELRIKVTADSSQFNRELDKAGKKTSGFSKKLGAAAKAGGLALGAGLVAGTAVSIKAASNLEEQINKVNVVFGKGAGTVLAFGETSADAFGISNRAALEAAGTFGNMLVPMGFARTEAGRMSVRMVELASDMASFNNASPEETLDALRSGLAGESEPLRRFGVFLNDARLKEEAMRLGLYKGKGQLDANAKAQATYALILKDTKDAQGDFANTSDTLANRQRILKARLEDTSAKIGQRLLPMAVKIAGFILDDLIPAGEQFVFWLQRTGDAVEIFGLDVAASFVDMGVKILSVFSTIAHGAGKMPGVLGKPFRRAADKIDEAKNSLDATHDALMNRKWEKEIKATARISIRFEVPAGINRVEEIRMGLRPSGDGIVSADQAVNIGRRYIKSFLPTTGVGYIAQRMARNPGGLQPYILDELAIGQSMGLSLSSGYRPGAITSTGHPSLHGVGGAIDMTGSPSQMMAFAGMMAGRSGIAEVLYTPKGGWYPGAGWTGLSGSLARDHYSHVHVGARSGDGRVGASGGAPQTINLVLDGAVVARAVRKHDGRYAMRGGLG